jgi:two-component system, NtrC family, nitrogen regulation sensor histidine kinase NtrY
MHEAGKPEGFVGKEMVFVKINMMKNWFLNYRFILLSFLLGLLAVFVNLGVTNLQDRRIPVRNVQEELWKTEAFAGKMADRLFQDITENGLEEFLLHHSDEFEHAFDKKGISLFYYFQDTLRYWNNNSVTANRLFSGSTFEQRLIRFPNSWQVSSVHDFGDHAIVALILVKKEYVFENAFLRNRFHPNFQSSTRAGISTRKEGKSDIFSKDGTYLFSLEKLKDEKQYWFPDGLVGLLSLFSFLFFLAFVLRWFRWFVLKTSVSRNLLVISVFGILILIRYLMLHYSFPGFLERLPLFDPYFYAKSFWFPSLGDFLLNALLLLFLAWLFYREFDHHSIFRLGMNVRICLFASMFFLSIYYLFFQYLLTGLVMNSSILIEVYNVFSLNPYTVVGYLGLSVLLGSLLLYADKFVSAYKGIFSFQSFLLTSTLSILIVFIPFMIVDKAVTLFQLVFMLIIVFVIAYFRFKRSRYSYANKLFLVFLMSLFTLFFLSVQSIRKEKDIRRVMAVNLANERDQIAEFLLEDIEIKLLSDPVLREMVGSNRYHDGDIYEYLTGEYFSRYFGKYDVQVATCGADYDLLLENTNELVDCYEFFQNMLDDHGVTIFPGSCYHYLDNKTGRISYLGVLTFSFPRNGDQKKLFISLDTKLLTEQLGYPELLLEGKFSRKTSQSNYSNAKYFRGKLISRSGEYPYALEYNEATEFSSDMLLKRMNGYSHLIYRVDEDNVIFISKKEISPIDIITSFSFLFIFYFLLFSIASAIRNYPYRLGFFVSNFKNRIRYAMLGVLLLSLIIVGVGTVIYNISQFRAKHYENISEKIQSVVVELEHKLYLENELNEELKDYITGLLIKFSNVFYTDINLFDTNGHLYASSRPEVFELGLTGTLMHPDAYREMLISKSAKYVHNEKIGELQFLSAYVPFSNANGDVLAYLNLPYFTRQDALREEIYALVVAVGNIYGLLILLTIFLALLVTNNITRPLRLIQDKIRMISLGARNEPLEYPGEDEIGELIRDYNRMVTELDKSAELLARSERESAWREMAKQIAHEIKNPLTPMKLSVQHLQKAWEDKAGNWEDLFHRTSRTLIEQIDNLSNIASEFSNFAKMPRASNERVPLIQKMKDIINLFTPVGNHEITWETGGVDEVYVYIDKEQLSRVFINLIKNALQSIPKSRTGKIHMDVRKTNKKVKVSISDNGIGITEEQQERMFQPNFTTKTSGMGLGLAIVKSILENANGSIRYDTEPGKGSVFQFELPLYQGKESFSEKADSVQP